MAGVVPSTNVIDRERFMSRLAQRFPDVAAKIDETDVGLIHLTMTVVARETCSAITEGREKDVAEHFSFMEEILERADSAVENAVHVSYLENIFLGEEKPAFQKARSQLPARLSKALVDLEAHFEKLANASRFT